jgi:hypothetical protein
MLAALVLAIAACPAAALPGQQRETPAQALKVGRVAPLKQLFDHVGRHDRGEGQRVGIEDALGIGPEELGQEIVAHATEVARGDAR